MHIKIYDSSFTCRFRPTAVLKLRIPYLSLSKDSCVLSESDHCSVINKRAHILIGSDRSSNLMLLFSGWSLHRRTSLSYLELGIPVRLL